MRNIAIIAKREIKGYFTTPLAYIFIVIFLAMSGAFAFYIGGFFNREQASLATFFLYHPWLYLMLVFLIGIKAVGGFVHDQNFGVVQHRLGEPDAALESLRQGINGLAQDVADIDFFGDGLDTAANFGSVEATDFGDEAKIRIPASCRRRWVRLPEGNRSGV